MAAEIGITDTITAGGFDMNSSFTTSFYNELAAVPSLHVGFAVAVGFALFAAVRNPVLRYAALLWGPVIGLAVVATGNHFVFDMIAGAQRAATPVAARTPLTIIMAKTITGTSTSMRATAPSQLRPKACLRCRVG